MKIIRKLEAMIAIAVIGLIPLFFSAAALAGEKDASAKKVKKETKEAFEAIRDYSADRRDEAVKEVRQAMDELDANIDAMAARIQNKWSEMDLDAREQAMAAMKSMRRQRNDLAEWYGGMKHSSAGAWEEVKKGFVDSYETLKESFDKAADKF